MTTAFVFSGEGARGSYQAGIVKALHKQGITADRVYGTSSGALNATGYSYLGPEKMEDVWSRIDRIGEVFRPNGLSMLWKNGAYSSEPLQEIVSNMVLKHNSRCPVTVTKANLLTAKLVYDMNTESPAHMFADSVVASASIPGLVEPMNGVWVDGGVLTLAPLKAAVRDGATKIFVIMAQPLCLEEMDSLKTLLKIGPVKIGRAASIAMRSADMMMQQILLNDLKLALKRNKMKRFRSLDIRVFGPEEMPYGGLDFKNTPSGFYKGYRDHIEFDLTHFC